MHYRMESLLDPADSFLGPESEPTYETRGYYRYTQLIMRDSVENPTVCEQRLTPVRQQGFLSPKSLDSKDVDFVSVKDWLTNCWAAHRGLCRVPPRPELQSTHLIDTQTNTVIPYSSIQKLEDHDIDYLCLSYVWGSKKQYIVRDGNRLLRVPKTIEDAMRFTRGIGKRYLWADSVGALTYNRQDMCALRQETRFALIRTTRSTKKARYRLCT